MSRYTREHGIAFLSVYPPDIIDAIQQACSSYSDPIAAVAAFREQHPAPFTPFLSFANMGPLLSPARYAHLFTGVTVRLSWAFTQDWTPEQLTNILTSVGLPGNYAARIAREVDTDDGASVAFGLQALQRTSMLRMLPAAMLPAAATLITGVAGLISSGESQRSVDTMAEDADLGEALEKATLRSIMTVSENVYTISNRGFAALQTTARGTTADALAGQAAALDPIGMIGTGLSAAADRVLGTLQSMFSGGGGSSEFPGGDPYAEEFDENADADLDATGFSDFAEETAAAATAAMLPERAPTTHAMAQAQRANPGRKGRRGKKILKGVTKLGRKALGGVPPQMIVKRAIRGLQETGEPLSTFNTRHLLERIDQELQRTGAKFNPSAARSAIEEGDLDVDD